jgi:hypothetical protein
LVLFSSLLFARYSSLATGVIRQDIVILLVWIRLVTARSSTSSTSPAQAWKRVDSLKAQVQNLTSSIRHKPSL